MKKILTVTILAAAIFAGKANAQDQQAPTPKTPIYITNQQAPTFSLKDVDGKTVSLTDFKGKVVVVDFWATWCGPCKSSFPGMQKVVDKYKKDPDVAFLFIDTRQTESDYKQQVKDFLANNHYTFHALFDEKGADGKMNLVMTKYKLIGIPTKFVIDADGLVRDEAIGFMPGTSDEDLANEVSRMIERAKLPPGTLLPSDSNKATGGK